MTVVALDDTDSRTAGMCTTYLAALLAERLDAERTLLVRLAPGVEHKTRGNAAVAVHTTASVERARSVAVAAIERHAAVNDPRTSPGLAVTGCAPDAVPTATATFARDAVRKRVSLDRAETIAQDADCVTVGWTETQRVTLEPDGTRRRESVSLGASADANADTAPPTNSNAYETTDSTVGNTGDSEGNTSDSGEKTSDSGGNTGDSGGNIGDSGGNTGDTGEETSDSGGDTADSGRKAGDSGGNVVGRGRIGAVAAIGAWRAFTDWTYERLCYRYPDRRGTQRTVDTDSVFAAAERAYPTAWDTVDREANEAVCVPHTPGPVLFGIRGDDSDTVTRVADAIDAEPIERARTFVTNQGTDAHLLDGTIGDTIDRRAYRLPAVVVEPPETRAGGHVFCTLAPPESVSSEPTVEPVESRRDDRAAVPNPVVAEDAPRVACAAFEPTKRFRDHVRALRVGDRLTVCGEVSDGTVKLEKFAVRGLVRTTQTTPTCGACGRSMASAGRNQGYRCRDCETTAPGLVREPIDRTLERGWYEVPPCARRHVAKPLVRGGFDAPTHPER